MNVFTYDSATKPEHFICLMYSLQYDSQNLLFEIGIGIEKFLNSYQTEIQIGSSLVKACQR